MRQSVADSDHQFPVRVLAVIVLYKMQPMESAAYRTIRAAISALENRQADIKLLLYDNTPGGQDPGILPLGVQYQADVENSGLARAYNYALEIAKQAGFDWLLTLDQDARLPSDFLSNLCHAVSFVTPLGRIAAIVPRVADDGRVVSPHTTMQHWIRTKPYSDVFIGIPLNRVYAANSASTISVSALNAIGGYNPDYCLNYSDIEMYHRLQCNNFRIFFAGNIQVVHQSSGFNLTERSSPIAYEDAVLSEMEFFDEYLGRTERIVLLLKLFCRPVYRIWRQGGSLPFLKIALKCLYKRLLYSRKHRMASWKQRVKRNPLTASRCLGVGERT
jgi:glycosyltransferase involved in cell wall biosynthesis